MSRQEKGHGGEPWPGGENVGMGGGQRSIVLISRAGHGHERRARAHRALRVIMRKDMGDMLSERLSRHCKK